MRFENPELLWAFLALLIPVLLHFLWKRRYQTSAFGAMTVLRRALAKRKDRLLWEQVLMIATRVLLLAALATALLNPALGRKATESRPAACMVLLFDNSYSMLAGEGLPRMERARLIAQNLMDSVEPQDEVYIASASEPELLAKAFPFHGGDDAKAALQALPVAWRPTDLCAALREACGVFKKSKCERRELFVLTDNQALSYGEFANPRWPAVAQQLRELSPTPRIFWVEAGHGEAWTLRNENLLVDPPQPAASVVHAGLPLAFYVKVRNTSETPVDRADVALEIDGRTVDQQALRLAARGEGVARFSCRFDRPGAHSLSATVTSNGDVLAADDSVVHAVCAQGPLRVLLVDGNLTPEPLHNESDLLRHALAPSGRSAPAYAVEVIVPAELHRMPQLQEYAAIAFLNVREPHEAIVNKLEHYAATGGGLLIVLGDRCSKQHYNATLYRDGRGLLPCQILTRGGDEAVRERFQTPAIAASDSPALALLGRNEAGFDLVRIHAWHKVQVPAFLDQTRTVLSLVPAGDPLVLERPFGRGMVCVATTGLNTRWSDFPIHPSFVLFVRSLVDSLSASRLPPANLNVGEPIEAAFAGAQRGAEHRLEIPGRQPMKLAVRRRFGSDRIKYDQTSAPGLYTLTSDKEGRPQKAFFAVNRDTRESDLQPVEPQAQAAMLAALGARQVSEWEDLKDLFKRSRRGLELWWMFLALAATFGMLELFLGKFFTRSFVDESKLKRGA